MYMYILSYYSNMIFTYIQFTFATVLVNSTGPSRGAAGIRAGDLGHLINGHFRNRLIGGTYHIHGLC